MKESGTDYICRCCQLRIMRRIELKNETPPRCIDNSKTRRDALILGCHHSPFVLPARRFTGWPLIQLRKTEALSVVSVDIPLAIRNFAERIHSPRGYRRGFSRVMLPRFAELVVQHIVDVADLS